MPNEKKTVTLVGVEHLNAYIHQAIQILKKKVKPGMTVGIELSPIIFKYLIKNNVMKNRRPFHPQKVFWFNVIRFLEKNNCTVVPIDISPDKIDLKTGPIDLLFRRKRFGEQVIRVTPKREKHMVGEITKQGLDMAIVGRVHLPGLYSALKKQEIPVRATQTKGLKWQRVKPLIRALSGLPQKSRKIKRKP